MLSARLTASVESAMRPSPALHGVLLPTPSEIIADVLGLELSAEDLRCLAEDFCARFNRELVPHLSIHDAVHAVLDEPPTARGERRVVEWQMEHACFDGNWWGYLTVVQAWLQFRGTIGPGAVYAAVKSEYLRSLRRLTAT